ncbi:indolepyruvate oxidoreductase subunit beta [Oxobacter pfennigii]|uniref:Indolepyruvate oxidoreductase subunit beta n=1 Tax=Oxobacter pfennigii TaxID=36849 RepID=A0A0P8WQS1_9CLOT|nr:indolepyruvate oxidoreductase subunit beta [Oxobacter pfennigii]
MTITSILLIGVGGQGTVLATKILTQGLLKKNYDVKMSEIHGAAQRGGSVTTQLRFGPKVYSPIVGKGDADIIVAFEESEALRALPFLRKGGKIIMDAKEIYPAQVQIGEAEYPKGIVAELTKVVGNVQVVKASEIAEKLGNVRSQNIVLLGTLAKALNITGVDWEGLVEASVPSHTKEMNKAAFKAGYEA